MKYIDQIIRHKIVEITFFSLLIIGSFPLWALFHQHNEFEHISPYSSTVYAEVINYQKYNFYPMSDEVAQKHLMPMKINLKNDMLAPSSYSMVLKVDKKSTLDYKLLKIAIDENVFYLKDLYDSEDSQFIYFLLSKGEIKGSTKEYQISLWIDNEVIDNYANETFLYSITNLETSFNSVY